MGSIPITRSIPAAAPAQEPSGTLLIGSMDPYRPPQSESVDAPAPRPRPWGRVVWVHLPLFGLLLWIFFDARALWQPHVGPTEWLVGVLLALPMAVGSLRKLHRRDASPSHWGWDLFYSATAMVAVVALALQQVGLAFALFLPTLVLNGLMGLAALWMEQRQRVRVYFSGRCVLVEDRRD
ncbi:MAG: hypothetical protein KDI56_00600 [Xanthomonadales bacterium]|nr:hypothetical protein [Xanthomonadales bacterium]MCB1629698.1 hypothetical protein [Xanthomonadales bacterium]